MLWLIRHAESEANAGLATADYGSIALTPRGHRQAELLASACRQRPARIICSPYVRAQLTAVPTLANFPEVRAEVLPVEEFTYLSFDGRKTTPAERLHLVHEYWERSDPDFRAGENAESFTMFIHRVNEFLAIARTWSGLTLVFSHEQFIRAVIWSLLVEPMQGTRADLQRYQAFRSAFAIPNGAYIPVEFRSDGDWVGGMVKAHLVVHPTGPQTS